MRLDLPPYVSLALTRLENAGFEAFAVGGCVRDSLLGRVTQDYDLATSALPEQTRAVFSGFPSIDTGLSHGTLTVLIDRRPLEITTYRTDGAYSDARHPDEVTFVRSIREDLARRDFTCNAMAYNPKTGLFDPFSGQKDLENRLLRAVGEPGKRFEEDALRVLRGLRFACQLGFDLEKETLSAMREKRHKLNRVSRERVMKELNLALLGEYAGTALARYPDLLTAALFKDNMEPPLPGFEEALAVLGHLEADLALRWAALLLFWDADSALRTMRDLRQSKALTEAVTALLSAIREEPGHPSLPLLIHRLGYPLAQKWLKLKRALYVSNARPDDAIRMSALEQTLLRYEKEGLDFTLGGLQVKGEDLMNLGYTPGEALGRELNRLLHLTLTGEIENSREALLKAAKARLPEE